MKPPYYKVIRCFICCLCFWGKASSCFSQNTSYDFSQIENISTKQGLSNNSPCGLLQDSRGFIWIATNYGLNRYDGNNFKVYNYDPTDSNSLLPGWYFSLLEDKNGLIWFSTSSNGFYSFNPRSEKFTRYYHQPDNPNSLAGEIHTGNITIDTSGTLWICTSAGLNSFDPVKKKFELFRHKEDDHSSLSSDNILWVCGDDENNIWTITSANIVDVFNITSKRVAAHFAIGSEQMHGNKNKPGLYTVFKRRNGNVWIGSEENGLYGFNMKTKTWKHFFNETESNFLLKNNGFNSCYEDETGNLLIGLVNYGLYYYEAASGKFYLSDQVKSGVNSIIKNRDGKIWIATSDEGVYTLDPANKKIGIIKRNPEKNNSLKSNKISSFYPFQKKELFIYGENEVYLFNTVSKTLQPFKIIDNGQDIFNNNITHKITQDSKNNFWFCTLNRLVKYDPRTKMHSYFRYNENDSNSLSSASAVGIVEDNNGKIWVTTFGVGLDLYDHLSKTFKAYRASDKGNSVSTNYLMEMLKTSTGIIYIGSWYGGLIQFNPLTETFKIFRHQSSDRNTISSDITFPLYEDKNGFIWAGTVGGGLNVFDPSKELFRTFTMQDGLPSNAVVSMIDDNDGKTWIGTYNGLACCKLPQNPFDKNVKINFRNYDISDGLPSNDLNFLGAYKDEEGSLYFSTSTAGFFYLNTKQWRDNEVTPPVYITGFNLMNKPVTAADSWSALKVPTDFSRELKLNYKQNILSFSFVALNFIHPEKNQYAYKLENYDKDWIITDASRRFANYTNLAPGNYVFKVKASNNDGHWNDTPAEIKIIITPPFWQTVWFRILVVMAVAAALYSFYRYRIGQILLLQRIRNKIATDLHDDIGSTLNSISVFSEVAKKDSAKRDQALQMIGESSRKIVDSMSDIVWSINPDNDSLDKIIFRMRSLSYNLLKAKKIECSFSADENLSGIKLPMEIRRNFYLIFKEALNNLVKYSLASHASILISREHGSITCIIRNNGVGFDNSQKYAGNGLGNMKKRAEEIDAGLSIESVIGKGTSIELNLKT